MPETNRRKWAVLAALGLAALAGLVLWAFGGGEPSTSSVEGEGRVVSEDAPERPAKSAATHPELTLAPRDLAPPPAPAQAQLKAGWGAAAGQLGRFHSSDPEGGIIEGPMSFAFGRDGQLLVLDQVNHRIVRYDRDGKVLGSISTTQRAPQDLAIASDGSIAMLDRLQDKTVSIVDSQGNRRGELPLSGPRFKSGEEDPASMPEAVTGVFVDGQDVYVQQANGQLVRLGDITGQVDPEQPEVPGRPSRDGQLYVLASVVDPVAGLVLVNAVDRATLEHRFTRQLRMGLPVLSIAALDTDSAGVIYLAAYHDAPSEPGAPSDGTPQVLALVCLSPKDGSLLGTTELPVSETPEETFRDLAVLPEGGVLYAYRSQSGISYQRSQCQR